jgi:hypothetical protein
MIKADLKCEEKASSILNLESFTLERAHGPKLPVGYDFDSFTTSPGS